MKNDNLDKMIYETPVVSTLLLAPRQILCDSANPQRRATLDSWNEEVID